MSLFVRSLTIAEGNHVQRILRHGKSRTPFRRAQVIIHSAHGYTVQEIAEVTCLHEEYIRELIRRFNREGVALFKERARHRSHIIESIVQGANRSTTNQSCLTSSNGSGSPVISPAANA
jgi:hypothetical protein